MDRHIFFLAHVIFYNILWSHFDFYSYKYALYDDKFLLLTLDMQYFIRWKQATVYQQLQCCFEFQKKGKRNWVCTLCSYVFVVLKLVPIFNFIPHARKLLKTPFWKKKTKEKLYLLIVFPVTFTWIRMDI